MMLCIQPWHNAGLHNEMIGLIDAEIPQCHILDKKFDVQPGIFHMGGIYRLRYETQFPTLG